MKLSNLMAVLALAAAAPAAAQVCPYQNLMPEFSEFVAATADLAPKARAEAFVERFAAKHPDFYSEQMFGSRQRLLERAERLFDPQRAPKFQGTRPLTLDDVLATGRTITADYARMEATFRKAFPDYHCETPITFGISLYMFDGNQSADTPGKPQMRFGVEMISALHPARELPAFFHHELFHIYQAQLIGADVPPDATQPVWWALWNEGLASYVSWKLQSGADRTGDLRDPARHGSAAAAEARGSRAATARRSRWPRRLQLQRARAVVVCANGAETPRLLLMSANSAFPQGLANSSGLVGEYLMFNYTSRQRPQARLLRWRRDRRTHRSAAHPVGTEDR
jgi:choline dehydrogenase-like flavoprotein